PPIKVLIVEDNMINQAILSTWMKKHNIKYEVASDGREAVDKWKKGGFHLVLMDIQLPVMSGIDATKTIRSIEKEQKIGVLPTVPSFHHQQSHDSVSSDTLSLEGSESMTPGSLQVLPPPPSPFRSPVIIVALTASSLESDRQAALAAGCNDFLTKPVSLEWLEQKIMEWGCMQALIDFEGWRKWKQAAQ
ncbi:CheY-like superfamily, partial [Phycomyces nitens]